MLSRSIVQGNATVLADGNKQFTRRRVSHLDNGLFELLEFIVNTGLFNFEYASKACFESSCKDAQLRMSSHAERQVVRAVKLDSLYEGLTVENSDGPISRHSNDTVLV